MEDPGIQQEINKYKKFKKVDGATYRKVNQFLRKRTYITAREWALARLCTDFRTSGGAEMTFIGMHLPELVPFMEDTYSPQAVNQARNSFKKKVRKASATFFYGAMCGFFTTDELDDLLFEASEVSRFLLEVEGTTLDIDEEIDIEDRITHVMRGVGEAAKTILKTRTEEEHEPFDAPKKRGRKKKDVPVPKEAPQDDVIRSTDRLSVIGTSVPGILPHPRNTARPPGGPDDQDGKKPPDSMPDDQHNLQNLPQQNMKTDSKKDSIFSDGAGRNGTVIPDISSQKPQLTNGDLNQ